MYHEIIAPLVEETDHGFYAGFGFSGWTAFITHPGAAKKLFSKTDLFPKRNMPQTRKETIFGKFVMEPNLVFLPHGPQWKEQRSVLNPAFHRSMPVQLFGELSQKLFNQIEKDEIGSLPIDVLDIMTRWTLDAIGIAGFDFDFNAITEKDNDWVTRYDNIMKASGSPLFMLFPFLDGPALRFLFPKRRKVHNELDNLLEKLQEIITYKREILASNIDGKSTTNKNINEKDLLTLMLEAA
ncbi:cytochrome P450 [Phascolomyces articulosus]|uniref:Cytochrome P450 n=1 Tax=Phascolomyces articulosus TaxID=60185 RepID=A0AAD5PA44_9FUNG|nr:cytochrome P450 [Phascolomyces articulosus]